MKEELRELYRYRELLYMLTYRDIKVRYKQSIMGFLWAVLMPVLIVLSGIVVRYAYALVSGRHLGTADIASVAVKSLPWAFLVSSIRFSCNSLIGNQNLVTKVYFPKEIFPVAAVLASLFDLFVASVALVILLLVIQTGWSANLVWAPLLLLMLVVLACGIGMIVSAASLFFRDVKFIVEVLLTFGIFFTPVFFDVRMVVAQSRISDSGGAQRMHRPPATPGFTVAHVQFRLRFGSAARRIRLLQALGAGLRGEHLTGEPPCLMSRSRWSMFTRSSVKERPSTPCAT
jgi:ABC-type polysaccharide/polyol phosphate export permease